MTRLYKLDLEPNEIYNVSLNIKQGNKTVDNLRFFQTRVPKLFNIKPSNFSTYSQIIETSDSVSAKVINSGISTGGTSDPPIGVKKVEWKSNKRPASREDGVTAYEPEGMEYTFIIHFDKDVSFVSYYLSGFTGFLDFLNYRTDYRTVGKTLTLTISLADIDPTAETKYSVTPLTGSGISPSIVDEVKAGYSTLYFSNSTDLSKVVVGKSVVTSYTTGARATAVWNRALVTGIGKFTDDKGRTLKWISVGKAALADKPASSQVSIYGLNSGSTFTGTIYGTLQLKGENTASKATVSNANIVWQTFPTYDAKNAKTEYTFKKSSEINSSVINPNVIEKLIWEDEVRDYIYFIISDIDEGVGGKGVGNKKKYFFGTSGVVKTFPTLAAEKTSLVGTTVFSAKSPPAANDYITNLNNKLPRYSTGKVKYYKASETKENDPSIPALLRTVQVQFAIARYIKQDDVWTGTWLPGNNLPEDEILSSPEELD